MISLKRWMGGALLAAALLIGGLWSQKVLADHTPGCSGPWRFLGRCIYEGFFTHADLGTTFQGTYVWWDGLDSTTATVDGTPAVTDAATFINRVSVRLNVDLSGCDLNPVLLVRLSYCADAKRNAIGSAFIINTMLGHQGPEFTGFADGIAQAKARFDDWAARVNYYEANNWVNWNDPFYSTTPGQADWIGDDSGRDILYSVFDDAPEPFVVFLNPNTGEEYAIMRRCANPKGTTEILEPPPPPPPPPPSGEWNYDANTTTSGVTVRAGDPIDINGYTSSNPSSTAAGPGYNQTIQVSSGSASPVGPTSRPFSSGLSPGELGGIQTVTFTIGTGTPVGGDVCFETTTSPAAGTNTGGVIAVTDDEATSAEVCVTIVDSPYLKVYGNDIWSGGAYELGSGCSVPPSGADVTKFGRIYSYVDVTSNVGAAAQFAAFAWGNIDAFGTAEIPSGIDSDRLAFANTVTPPGQFGAERCLSGLFDDDTNGHASGQIDDLLWDNSDDQTGGPSYGTAHAAINNNADDGQFTFSVDQVIHPSTITKRVTVLISGNVTIQQNIVNTNNYGTVANPTIPIVVIIATGDIIIEPDVTQLDGIFIAQGTIDTCDGTQPLTIDVCDEPLEINGSFIANRIAFRRTAGSLTGAATSSGAYTSRCDYNPSPTSLFPIPASLDIRCAAEIFRFSPEIYLANPIFRRGTSSELPIRQLRELPPLF